MLLRITSLLLLTSLCFAQEPAPEPSLGDLARQERERKASTPPQLGETPPQAVFGEFIPAHFLRFEGDVAHADWTISLNNKPILHNGRVKGLPYYISPNLLAGANLLAIDFTSHTTEPLDLYIEERWPGSGERRELAHFHADANQFPEPTHKDLQFSAHPRIAPPIVLTDSDRQQIATLIQTFYDTLTRRDGPGLVKLFEPAIEDARPLYPEGADFGHNEIAKLSRMIGSPSFAMRPYNPEGLKMEPAGNVVEVTRAAGGPVFISLDVAADTNNSRVNALLIPVKKINGVWRLTLPFGF
jgi:hypothetical protein